MRKTRRTLFLSVIAGGATLSTMPKRWSQPVVNAVVTPAHAQTSAECSGFEVEPVDRSIDIVVTATEVRGPIVAALGPTGTFGDTQTEVGGSCTNGAEFSQEINFSGTLDSATNQISGDLIIRQFCGSELFCEQVSVYTATQTPQDASSDLGSYQGRVTGTQTCCQDFF